MKKDSISRIKMLGFICLVSLCLFASPAVAQENIPQNAPHNAVVTPVSAVPRLVNFSGKAVDAQGKTFAGAAGVTFSIYREQTGGSPIWIETQNVQADARGSYTAQLGATKNGGLPVDLFSTNEPRWLGVRVNGGEEQARVLLLSVPYALKAADAETVGGLPPSAFMLAAPVAATAALSPAGTAAPGVPPPPAAITGTGTVNFLPIFTANTTIGNSALFQTGASPNAKVGINNNAPGAALDVKGNSNFGGQLTMPSNGIANAGAGKKSQVIEIRASSFNSGTSTAVPQNFVLAAEPVANNSANPSGTLNLLYAAGSAAPAETGLKINNKGQITFAAGQTFPGGSGSGTVTSVGLSAPASDFTVSGSPVKTAGTLALNWNVAPTSTDTANAIVKRDSAGAFSAGRVSGNGVGDFGVTGQTDSVVGVGGFAGSGLGGQFSSNTGVGLVGQGATNIGIEGISGSNYAVVGISTTTAGGLFESNGSTSTPTGFGPDGVVGTTGANVGTGVVAINTNSSGLALLAINQGNSSTGPALEAFGASSFFGTLTKPSGSFKIDHPLDPANKYLYHSFVESPDMMNIYNGVVKLDAKGQAAVAMPDWFESLNQDFRYQLTAIGAPGPNLYIAAKVQKNTFKIAGGKPGMEVSWQVTGIRHDAYANAHRIQVEVEKEGVEKGLYLYPELFGETREKSIMLAHHPELRSTQKITPVKSANPE
jgi:trimeric autotransporter adhesin